jgi:hypothetical protein
LEQGLQIFKKQPPQKLKTEYWYATRAWGFVTVSYVEGRCNFIKGNSGERELLSRVVKTGDIS